MKTQVCKRNTHISTYADRPFSVPDHRKVSVAVVVAVEVGNVNVSVKVWVAVVVAVEVSVDVDVSVTAGRGSCGFTACQKSLCSGISASTKSQARCQVNTGLARNDPFSAVGSGNPFPGQSLREHSGSSLAVGNVNVSVSVCVSLAVGSVNVSVGSVNVSVSVSVAEG